MHTFHIDALPRIGSDYDNSSQSFGNYGILPNSGSESAKNGLGYSADIRRKNETSPFTYDNRETDKKTVTDFQRKSNFGLADDFSINKPRTQDIYPGGYTDSNKIQSNNFGVLPSFSNKPFETYNTNSRTEETFNNILQKFRDHDAELNIFLNINSNHLIGKGVAETLTPDQYYEKIMSKYRN